MDNLTVNEKLVLNNLTAVRGSDAALGDKIQALIDSIPGVGTPVNAVNATEILTFGGVSVDSETLWIDNPAKSGIDIYEFLADLAQSKTQESYIAVNITSYVGFASGTLTMDVQPTAGDTVTVGNDTYIFVPVGTDTAHGEVSIGADLAEAQANLVAAINGTDEISFPNALVSIADFADDAAVLTALIGGTAANLLATTETFTAETNVFAAATLTGGTNCTASNSAIAMGAAITAHDTQDVAGVRASSTVVLTADVPGVLGNEISVISQIANATLPNRAENLSGGVDGTVCEEPCLLMDTSYLYVSPVANPLTGKNWRRISIGSAY